MSDAHFAKIVRLLVDDADDDARRLIHNGVLDLKSRRVLNRLLGIAVTWRKTSLAREMLELGANPNAKDDVRIRPVIRAATSGPPELLELLLQAGADPHSTDWLGRSALDNAREAPADYQKQNVALLLRYGAGTDAGAAPKRAALKKRSVKKSAKRKPAPRKKKAAARLGRPPRDPGLKLRLLAGHSDEVRCLRFSPNGKWLATCGTDRSLRLWSAGTGREVAVHKAGKKLFRLGWSPDGTRLVVSGESKLLTFEVGEDGSLRPCSGVADEAAPGPFAWSGDGRRFASFVPEGPRRRRRESLRIVETASGRSITAAPTPDGYGSTIGSLAFACGGELLAGADQFAADVFVWDAATGELLRTFEGHIPGEVYCVAASPKESLVATGGQDEVVRLWDPRTAEERAVLQHSYWVPDVQFSKNGRVLATVDQSMKVRLWDVASAAETLCIDCGHCWDEEDPVFGGGEQYFWSMALSPDAKRVAISGNDGLVAVWRVP